MPGRSGFAYVGVQAVPVVICVSYSLFFTLN